MQEEQHQKTVSPPNRKENMKLTSIACSCFTEISWIQIQNPGSKSNLSTTDKKQGKLTEIPHGGGHEDKIATETVSCPNPSGFRNE
ncbi:hypothetical protein LINPERHAP1_LOCUS33268 [Linum perenne]